MTLFFVEKTCDQSKINQEKIETIVEFDTTLDLL